MHKNVSHIELIVTSAGFVGAIAVLLIPFIISQVINCVDEKRFSKTIQGRRRRIAEDLFDKSTDEKRLKSSGIRPLIGVDGSTIVTIFYGIIKPPRRAYYKFTGDSMEPQRITSDEAALHIDIQPWR